ncbi:MAG: TIGR00730 family Rossman fold protein [Bacteroidota bacterium]
MIKSIGIFCGSAKGSKATYVESAKLMARLLANKNIGIVYGGGNIGLMGTIADETIAHKGEIIGVIPTHLLEKELAHENLTELIEVKDMGERKDNMIALSDAFLILPGGYGTMDELFEVLSLNQLHLINKPCLIYNIEGYFDTLITFILHAVEQGFVKKEHLSFLIVDNTPEALFEKLGNFVPEHNLDNWIVELKGGKNPE